MQPTTIVVCVAVFLLQAVVVKGQVDIVQTAINLNFTTLVAAVQAADLVTTLKGPGPFTVFAPTDAAFNKLPSGVVSDLIMPDNKATLSRILQYHVIGGRVTAADINSMTLPTNVTMLAGGSVTVSRDGANLKINSATVVIPDVMATNGVIHAIDTVLLPPLDTVETAITNGNFKTLVTALKTAGLVDTLKGPGPFTVFAPTDAAFNKLPAGTVTDLLKPENKDKLVRILKFHVIESKRLTAEQILAMNPPFTVAMLSGELVKVTKDGNNLKLNDATVTTADVFTTNGIIHVVDTVLLPPADDVVDIAVKNAAFSTLVTALTTANLVPTLKGAGPFTVFAPTNAAFDKLGANVVADLLKPENKEKLSRILQYHVIGKRVSATDINAMTLPATVEMLAGGTVTVKKDGNDLKVNDATVTTADVLGANGIIHIIDTVLQPVASSATSFYLNQGLFTVLVSIMLFSYRLFV